MQKQSSSLDDSSLNIAFFSVLFISLFSFFLFTEGETPGKEGEENTAVLSSVDESVKKESAEEIAFLGEDTLFASSSNSHFNPQVMGAREIEEDQSSEEIKEEQEEEGEEDEVNVKETLQVELTGYSSTPDQTNSQPFITASGYRVRKGIVAANFLEFGTKLRIPEYFGEKEFVVKDRMNRRFSPPYDHVSHEGYVDIWFENRYEANNFGRVISEIEIIE